MEAIAHIRGSAMRPTLLTHPKFRRLCAVLGAPQPHVVGYLELLWNTAYESGDPVIGDSIDVELACGWQGDTGVLTDALLTCGGDDRAGFIDQLDGGAYEVHDLWHHAPEYVKKRAARENARRERGTTIAEERAAAGKKGAVARWQTADSCHENSPKMANGSHLPRNGWQMDGKRRPKHGKRMANGTTPAPAPTIDLQWGEDTPLDPITPVLTLEDPSSPLSSSDLTSERGTKNKKTKGEAIGSATWEAYASAYTNRYGVPPARNQQSNALCKNLVKALGAEEAPAVAAYYVTSNYAYYVQRGHNLKILVSDAVKLRTEWATGRRVSQSQAREGDRLQGQGDGWRDVIKERGRS